jgi:glycosyltransferase involved in cell wall biosynthesis
MAKILLFANTDWYLYNFRLALIRHLRVQGHEIILLSPPGEFQDQLKAQGFAWMPFPLSRQGINPLKEIQTLVSLRRIYRQVKPDVVHHFTIKPVIYGSFIARRLKIPGIINSITGLGHVFIDPGIVTRVVRFFTAWMYRISLRGTQVIFENPTDRDIFIQNRFTTPAQTHLILGTGVDVEKFRPTEKSNAVPLVLFSSRLLATKGLFEFMDAIRILKAKGLNARFAIAGTPDPGNPASISQGQLDSWRHESLAELWGWQDDMPAALAQADIFCLPSYREGVPNALLEACASGLPIVTTDVPGCRDVVQHGVNGLLVPPQDGKSLAGALETLLNDATLRSTMGNAGRQIALEKFSHVHIISHNMAVYDRVIAARKTQA